MMLYIHVEGQTEYNFAQKILTPYFETLGYTVKTVINQTSPAQRGGITKYSQFQKNTRRLQQTKQPCLITTMIDLFPLPKGFPGQEKITDTFTGEEKVKLLEKEMKRDMEIKPPNIFIPYIQLHEFEALLFSDIDALYSVLKEKTGKEGKQKLTAVLNRFRTPESINTGEGPSCKLLKITNRKYNKLSDAEQIIEKIPLETIRKQCPHFNCWIEKIEQTAAEMNSTL